MKRHKNSDVLCISLLATRKEQEYIELVREKRKFNSFSHTLRVLITEAAEKIIAQETTIINND